MLCLYRIPFVKDIFFISHHRKEEFELHQLLQSNPQGLILVLTAFMIITMMMIGVTVLITRNTETTEGCQMMFIHYFHPKRQVQSLRKGRYDIDSSYI